MGILICSHIAFILCSSLYYKYCLGAGTWWYPIWSLNAHVNTVCEHAVMIQNALSLTIKGLIVAAIMELPDFIRNLPGQFRGSLSS